LSLRAGREPIGIAMLCVAGALWLAHVALDARR
jgi:hypothetical protein